MWCLGQDGELRNGDVSYSHFAQLYRSLMFDAQKSVSYTFICVCYLYVGGAGREVNPSSEPLKPHQLSPTPSVCPASQMAFTSILALLKSRKIHRLKAIRTHTHSPLSAGVISAVYVCSSLQTESLVWMFDTLSSVDQRLMGLCMDGVQSCRC